jgi:two-component system response regulator
MPDKTILLVEDEPDDQLLTLKALRQQGVVNRVVLVRDGAAALDYLFNPPSARTSHRAPLPTLVLLDLNLPRVGGFEVLERIRAEERTARLPVVILTASEDDEDAARGRALGANAFVRKPLAFTDFARATRTLGFSWLLLKEAPSPEAPGL